MTLGPTPTPGAAVRQARAAARRQAQTLSGTLGALVGIGAAILMVAAFALLDYGFDQDPHRIVKILMAVVVVAAIVVWPRFGLLVLPVVTPFLPWLPLIPVPGLNPLNVLVITIFVSFALQKVMRREPVFRKAEIGVPIGVLVLLAALSVVRGVAIPAGFAYDGAEASLQLFRSSITFAMYFITLAMIKGEKGRRAIAWAVVLGLLAEAVTTAMLGRNGRGARAIGTLGQSNELGAFLAMFTVFAAALLPAVKKLFGRLVLLAAVGFGTYATLLSVSRGALIALGVALVYVTMRSSRALTIVLAVVLLSSPLWTPDYVKDRFTGTEVEVEGTDEAQLEGSAQARIDTWTAVYKLIQAHPFDGVGFIGLGYVLPDTGDALGLEVKDSAHNTYLRMLSELGVLGLVAFIWLLWRCFRLAEDGVRAARSRFDRQLALGVAGMTLAMAISCAFGDRFFSVLISGNLWIACGLVNDQLLESRGEAA